MIKSITITNHLGESIKMELMKPESSGFIIESIEGLGPAKADVNFTTLATMDGAIDNSARLDYRNIVLKLIFLENPTIEDTRLKSYQYFPIKRNITFLIETDRRICETTGRVETNTPAIFSKSENDREGCQISIMCPDPYFYSAGPNKLTETVFYGIESLFEFPFSNESLSEKLIEFGEIKNQTEATVYYEGDAEVGIIVRIHAIGPVEGLKIYNLTARQILGINDEKLTALTGAGIQAGDEIVLNTNRGTKSITLTRAGVVTNILNVLDKPIPWFRISKGDNIFAYRADAGISNLQFRIENQVLYEGV